MKYSTVITYKNKYNITEYDRYKIDKKDVLKIIEYSSKHCIPEKEAITSLGYNISTLSYYKRKFGIETHPYGNAPFTARIKRKYSVFRRMITGCYHDVSDEHLQSYIDEACFRWNTRKMAESERFSQMFHTSIGLVKPNREFVLCKVA